MHLHREHHAVALRLPGGAVRLLSHVKQEHRVSDSAPPVQGHAPAKPGGSAELGDKLLEVLVPGVSVVLRSSAVEGVGDYIEPWEIPPGNAACRQVAADVVFHACFRGAVIRVVAALVGAQRNAVAE